MRNKQTRKKLKDPNSTDSLIVRASRYRAFRISVGVGLIVILLLVAFTGPEIELSITSVLGWLGNTLVTVAKWCIGIIVAILLLRDAHAWFGTIRSLGLPSFQLCRRVYMLTERTNIKSHAHGWARIVSGVGIISVLLVLWAIIHFDIFLWLAGFRLVFLLHEPLDNGRPPTVLLLGASSCEVTRLQSDIEKVVHENRVVSLLNLPPSALDLSSEVHEWDVFRVPDEESWEWMVQELVSITPVVVLDSRIFSKHVMHELEYMLNPKRSHKLIVVVDDRLDWASKQDLPGIPARRICKTKEVFTLLHEITRSRRSLPKPYSQLPYNL